MYKIIVAAESRKVAKDVVGKIQQLMRQRHDFPPQLRDEHSSLLEYPVLTFLFEFPPEFSPQKCFGHLG